MFRKDLIDILKERTCSLHDLALILEASPNDLEDDLNQPFRSLRCDPLHPVITPATAASTASESTRTNGISRGNIHCARGPGSVTR